MVQQYISDYIKALKHALDLDNPNDKDSEIWDEKAIDALANYYYMNDYAVYDLSTLEHVYAQYDIVKFIQQNAK